MNQSVKNWVDEIAALVRPESIHWCDGSEAEYQKLIDMQVESGDLHPLNPETYPGSYLARSNPNDVARTEHCTYICTETEAEVGPTNNWMSIEDGRTRLNKQFEGCFEGRTMYVIPYIMGPAGSPYSKVGYEVTDSPYVVVNMRKMTRMGQVAIDQLGDSDDFCRGVHCLGDLDPETRIIAHFPKTREIWSFGSGYGGNALLGKKCFALRIASAQGRDEMWMAEHMLIVGIEDPEGNTTYVAAAFPSACGKTNLAMMVPPASQPGWKVWTVGDDIAWMRKGPDGRLWAINPENGYFGVAPGTSSKTNPNAMTMTHKDAIFTNVAVTENNEPWWEGFDGDTPSKMTDWKGNEWTSASEGKAAHPNSRFTVPAVNCDSISPKWEDPQGVPISAIVFGGRRAKTAPLVFQAKDWNHGTFVGAGMASETTAAQTGAVGVVRRDPMAMLPFCGYNMAEYWGHWVKMGETLENPPAIFHVNWFRTDDNGKFTWPGFGENLRVLRWIVARVNGQGEAVESPIGMLPTPGAIDTNGIDIKDEVMEDLLSVDTDLWREEAKGIEEFFAKFGDQLPAEMKAELDGLKARLG